MFQIVQDFLLHHNMDLDELASVSILLASAREAEIARAAQHALLGGTVPVAIAHPQYAVAATAPSAEIAGALHVVASTVAQLDSVSSDARSLASNLSSFTAQAESAVRRVRQLDGLRNRLQASFERVEDLIDLQASLSGVQEAITSKDLTAAAMHLQRLHSLRRNLPVPDSDVEFMAGAEAVIMKEVLARFDAALAENERDARARASSEASATAIAAAATSPAAAASAERERDVGARISQCCRLLGMLGHGQLGLKRYCAYLRQTLDSAYRRDLLGLASQGVDAPASAVNALSAWFARAVNTLAGSADMAAGTFGRAAGPAAVFTVAHAACDAPAARVLRSVARSARVQAALNAREAIVAEAEAPLLGLGGAAPSSSVSSGGGKDRAGSGSEDAAAVYSLSAADAGRIMAAIEDAGNAAPFVLPLLTESGAVAAAGGRSAGPTSYRSVPFTDTRHYEALLDELAMILQRCASYARIMGGKAGDIDAGLAAERAKASREKEASSTGAGVSSSSAVAAFAASASAAAGAATAAAKSPTAVATASTAAADSTRPTDDEAVPPADTALREHRGVREAAAELSSVYSVLEQGRILAAVARAISMDEALEDGAAAASVDIMSGRALAALEAPAPAAGSQATAGAASSSQQRASGGAASAGAASEDGFIGAAAGAGEEDVEAAWDGAVGPASAGVGAVVSSLVEDAVYVASVACRRAFATGSADAAAAVVNHAVYALTDRLASELSARLRVALEDPSAAVAAGVGAASGGGAGGKDDAAASLFSFAAIAPAQRERLAALRSTIMTSSPVKMAAAKLAELQNIPPSSRDAALAALAGGARNGGARGGAASPALGSPGVGRSGAGALSSPGPAGSAGPIARLTAEVAAAALALNNLQLAGACALRMRAELEAQCDEVFGAAASTTTTASASGSPTIGSAAAHSADRTREASKVRVCVAGMNDVYAQLRRSLDAGLTVLLTRLTPRLRTALNVFEGASSLIRYELSDAEYAASEAGEGGLSAFHSEFLPVLAAIIAPYQYALTPPLAVHVALRVAGYVARQLEPRVRRKRFNLLGALRFDADIRSLAAFFEERTALRARTRARFARLLQMAQLLTSETVAEALMLLPSTASSAAARGASASGWEISSEEARAILAQRVDWTPADLARLRA